MNPSNDGPSTTAVDDQLRGEPVLPWKPKQLLVRHQDGWIAEGNYVELKEHHDQLERENKALRDVRKVDEEQRYRLIADKDHAERALAELSKDYGNLLRDSTAELADARDKVLEEAAEECLRVWHDALVGSQQNALSHGCVSSADAIRTLKTEAAQKDQRGGTPSVLNGQVESTSVSNLPPLQDAAAMPQVGLNSKLENGASEAQTVSKPTAAAPVSPAPCAEGPSGTVAIQVLRKLVEQIQKGALIDDHGHAFKMNQAYITAQVYLQTRTL